MAEGREEDKKLRLPGLKPYTRQPIKPAVRHVDRKNDYRRQDKHKKPEEGLTG